MSKQSIYKQKNKDKIKAQNIALNKYKKAKICSVEGCKEIGERHHADYKQPDIIIWLCRKHHKILHYPKKRCLMIEGREKCTNTVHAKNLCKRHYARVFRKKQGW